MAAMRTAGSWLSVCLAVLLAGAGGVTGCKNKGDAGGAPDEAALRAQRELLAKRDALLATRNKLQSDRDKLDVEIRDIQAKGGDATAQLKQKAELESQLDSQVSDLLGMVGGTVDAIKASGDKAVALAAREAQMSSREKSIADREARVAERERLLAEREVEAAARWKDSCTTGAAPVIIQQAAPAGGTYSRKDVSNLIHRAKGTMSRKGLLDSDLPGPAQELEDDASKALAANDMGKAYFAARQLLATVESIQVNRAFIQAKTGRLSARLKSSKVDAATNQQAADILRDVMQKYNAGQFTAANKRLNTLASRLAH